MHEPDLEKKHLIALLVSLTVYGAVSELCFGIQWNSLLFDRRRGAASGRRQSVVVVRGQQ